MESYWEDRFKSLESFCSAGRDFILACDDAPRCSDSQELELNLSGLKNLTDFLSSVASKQKNLIQELTKFKPKIIFVGSSKRGKSTLIEAILGKKVLPNIPESTTKFFIEVSGTDDDEPKLLTNNGQEIQDIQNITSDSGDSIEKLKFGYPKNQSPLLKNGFVMLDTPGLEVCDKLASESHAHCRNYDVVVLVANAAVGLTKLERQFVKAIQNGSSKPKIILVVFNKWDCLPREDPSMISEIREQHETTVREFLTNDLGIDSSVARESIFFVSATEALESKLHGDSNRDIMGSYSKEFKDFELMLLAPFKISIIRENVAVFSTLNAKLEEITNKIKMEVRDKTSRHYELYRKYLRLYLNAREKCDEILQNFFNRSEISLLIACAQSVDESNGETTEDIDASATASDIRDETALSESIMEAAKQNLQCPGSISEVNLSKRLKDLEAMVSSLKMESKKDTGTEHVGEERRVGAEQSQLPSKYEKVFKKYEWFRRHYDVMEKKERIEQVLLSRKRLLSDEELNTHAKQFGFVRSIYNHKLKGTSKKFHEHMMQLLPSEKVLEDVHRLFKQLKYYFITEISGCLKQQRFCQCSSDPNVETENSAAHAERCSFYRDLYSSLHSHLATDVERFILKNDVFESEFDRFMYCLERSMRSHGLNSELNWTYEQFSLEDFSEVFVILMSIALGLLVLVILCPISTALIIAMAGRSIKHYYDYTRREIAFREQDLIAKYLKEFLEHLESCFKNFLRDVENRLRLKETSETISLLENVLRSLSCIKEKSQKMQKNWNEFIGHN